MLRRTVDSETSPTDAAKYDDEHHTVANRPGYPNSCRHTRAVRPVNARTTRAGTSVEPTRTNRCTRSPALRRHPPRRTRHRHFADHTTCRPTEHTPPAVRRNLLSDIPRTLRSDTDKLTTTRCSPAPIPRGQSQRSHGAHSWNFSWPASVPPRVVQPLSVGADRNLVTRGCGTGSLPFPRHCAMATTGALKWVAVRP
jgi:hypothetical protein